MWGDRPAWREGDCLECHFDARHHLVPLACPTLCVCHCPTLPSTQCYPIHCGAAGSPALPSCCPGTQPRGLVIAKHTPTAMILFSQCKYYCITFHIKMQKKFFFRSTCIFIASLKSILQLSYSCVFHSCNSPFLSPPLFLSLSLSFFLSLSLSFFSVELHYSPSFFAIAERAKTQRKPPLSR